MADQLRTRADHDVEATAIPEQDGNKKYKQQLLLYMHACYFIAQFSGQSRRLPFFFDTVWNLMDLITYYAVFRIPAAVKQFEALIGVKSIFDTCDVWIVSSQLLQV